VVVWRPVPETYLYFRAAGLTQAAKKETEMLARDMVARARPGKAGEDPPSGAAGLEGAGADLVAAVTRAGSLTARGRAPSQRQTVVRRVTGRMQRLGGATLGFAALLRLGLLGDHQWGNLAPAASRMLPGFSPDRRSKLVADAAAKATWRAFLEDWPAGAEGNPR
jgi:hypothetical protein